MGNYKLLILTTLVVLVLNADPYILGTIYFNEYFSV